MPEAKIEVAVRMYHVGFGDAFTITVRRADAEWRMLVDCGVHAQGQNRPLTDSVATIIGDLTDDAGRAAVDVVVATHRHADHIAGFALDDWAKVEVGEVWVPFVEDPDDPDATTLRTEQEVVADRLHQLLQLRRSANSATASSAMAMGMAVNSRGNARATNRLLSRDGLGFATPHRVRYLPSRNNRQNLIATPIPNVRVHILGPSRDPEFIKRMNPPKSARWFALDDYTDGHTAADTPLFADRFRIAADTLIDPLLDAQRGLKLSARPDDTSLLAAASILERSVNNTSLFFVLDVAGTKLLFPGDAQYGAWQHLLERADIRRLLSEAIFYKIGHHGSHNATPKEFIENLWADNKQAMLPWHPVQRWPSIPDGHLIDALHQHGHTVVRADQDIPVGAHRHGDDWSEVRFEVLPPG
ncbi:MAG: hypothetical protein EOP32_00425 [Rhodococcus sp. (in: high G+C Gram-positive bacteria)]|nr:MAG: hypothetical protein EOP32_00425 [Rhodococcus sp. (in: high G+C Gram-positive bacteria)]